MSQSLTPFDYTTLVTDRTQGDVDALSAALRRIMDGKGMDADRALVERTDQRGAYNYTDLNRVSACMEALRRELEGLGVQLTGYERVKIERTAKPTGQKKYRYLRMSITANRGSTNILQLSEIQIVSATGTLLTWPDGTTITASIAATSDSENVSKLIDGDTSTKFCSTAFSNSCDIDIDLGSQMLDRTEYTSWRWYTANDAEARDPVSFELLGSVDGETYTSFDAVTSATIPTDRKALAYSGCIGVLPSNYTQLASITSTGEAYIVADVYPTNKTRVVADMQLPTAPSSHIGLFGSRTSYNTSDQYVLGVASNKVFRSDFAAGQATFASSVDCTARSKIDKNGPACTINGTTVNNTDGTFTSSRNLMIFGINTAGAIGNRGTMTLWAFVVYEAGALVRDFIPAQNAAGAVGLYDLVGAKFYANAGTGSFTAGDVVEQPDDPDEPDDELDPYTWYESDAPTAPQLAQYLANVSNIRAALPLPEGTASVPESMAQLRPAQANAIEQILAALEIIIKHIPAAVRHCGVTICGSKGVIT